ncbi:MAG: hypothetical protein ABUK01_10410 [Leptospirales bacterium]
MIGLPFMESKRIVKSGVGVVENSTIYFIIMARSDINYDNITITLKYRGRDNRKQERIFDFDFKQYKDIYSINRKDLHDIAGNIENMTKIIDKRLGVIEWNLIDKNSKVDEDNL